MTKTELPDITDFYTIIKEMADQMVPKVLVTQMRYWKKGDKFNARTKNTFQEELGGVQLLIRTDQEDIKPHRSASGIFMLKDYHEGHYEPPLLMPLIQDMVRVVRDDSELSAQQRAEISALVDIIVKQKKLSVEERVRLQKELTAKAVQFNLDEKLKNKPVILTK